MPKTKKRKQRNSRFPSEKIEKKKKIQIVRRQSAGQNEKKKKFVLDTTPASAFSCHTLYYGSRFEMKISFFFSRLHLTEGARASSSRWLPDFVCRVSYCYLIDVKRQSYRLIRLPSLIHVTYQRYET